MKLAIFDSCQFGRVCFSMQVPCLYHWVYSFKYYFFGMLWTPSSISSGLLSVSIGHKLLASSLRFFFWYNYIHLPEFPCKIKVMINGVLLLCVVIVYFQIRHLQPWPGVTSRLFSRLMFWFVVCWWQVQCRSRDSTVFGCSSARIAIIQISSPPTSKIVVCIILSYPHFLLGFQIKSSHFPRNFWNSWISHISSKTGFWVLLLNCHIGPPKCVDYWTYNS